MDEWRDGGSAGGFMEGWRDWQKQERGEKLWEEYFKERMVKRFMEVERWEFAGIGGGGRGGIEGLEEK